MKGVLLGVVEDDEGRPHVALQIPKGSTIVMSVGYAGILHDQLSMILDNLGYFNEEGNEPGDTLAPKKGELH